MELDATPLKFFMLLATTVFFILGIARIWEFRGSFARDYKIYILDILIKVHKLNLIL